MKRTRLGHRNSASTARSIDSFDTEVKQEALADDLLIPDLIVVKKVKTQDSRTLSGFTDVVYLILEIKRRYEDSQDVKAHTRFHDYLVRMEQKKIHHRCLAMLVLGRRTLVWTRPPEGWKARIPVSQLPYVNIPTGGKFFCDYLLKLSQFKVAVRPGGQGAN